MRVKDILLKQKLWFSWNNITSRIIVKGKKKGNNLDMRDDKVTCCIWERMHTAAAGYSDVIGCR